MNYVGFDILAGDNVDIVGDAHELSSHFPERRFDFVLSMSVFEHLLMPWQVALEINKVMKPGGRLLITSHQAFPIHDAPWDYWRFSDRAWLGMFNATTGFRILETALGEQCLVVPQLCHPAMFGLEMQPAFIGSAVLIEKISDSNVQWAVKHSDIIDTPYPM